MGIATTQKAYRSSVSLYEYDPNSLHSTLRYIPIWMVCRSQALLDRAQRKSFHCCLGSAKLVTLLATNLSLPQIGAVLFASGSVIGYLCMQMYLVDTYTRYAASASAASTFLRSLATFSFPLFAPYLFNYLGYGWGSSTLGLAAIVLGIPAPFLEIRGNVES